LVEPERASWLWGRLKRAFGDASSCVLMPAHVHLETPEGRRDALQHVLTGYTRRFGVRFDILDPEPANSPAIAARQIRYQYFNPMREGLVTDPFCWPWSTLRDLVGACHPTWTDLPSIASMLQLPPQVALRRLTNTADYAAPPPSAELPLVASRAGVIAAVGSALRLPPNEVIASPTGRRLVVQASCVIGEPSPARLADVLGCNERTIRRARQPRDPALDAVLRCMAEPRLLIGPGAQSRARGGHIDLRTA
jgi:hypothetical protein